jgi:predicted transcriptional regulator
VSNKNTESTTLTQVEDESAQRRNVLVSDETWRKIKVLAAHRDQTTSDVVEVALSEYAAQNAA